MYFSSLSLSLFLLHFTDKSLFTKFASGETGAQGGKLAPKCKTNVTKGDYPHGRARPMLRLLTSPRSIAIHKTINSFPRYQITIYNISQIPKISKSNIPQTLEIIHTENAVLAAVQKWGESNSCGSSAGTCCRTGFRTQLEEGQRTPIYFPPAPYRIFCLEAVCLVQMNKYEWCGLF